MCRQHGCFRKMFKELNHKNLQPHLNSRCTQNKLLWIMNLGQETNWAIFLQKMRRKERLIIGSCWMNFCSRNLKKRILATFGFNKTALRATHPIFKIIFWRSIKAVLVVLFYHRKYYSSFFLWFSKIYSGLLWIFLRSFKAIFIHYWKRFNIGFFIRFWSLQLLISWTSLSDF